MLVEVFLVFIGIEEVGGRYVGCVEFVVGGGGCFLLVGGVVGVG